MAQNIDKTVNNNVFETVVDDLNKEEPLTNTSLNGKNQVLLTTIDNPYDPFTQFTQWLMFDIESGYNTCGYLDRITVIPEDASEMEAEKIVEESMNRIIDNDFLGIYKKVYLDG